MNASNTFVFGKSWTGELTGWLRTPAVEALFHSRWIGTLDMGIQKEIGTNLKAKFSFQDVFHTNRYRGETIAPGFRSVVDLSFDTRVAMLSLTYNFGNQQLKANRQRKTGSEEERQRMN